MTTLYTLVLSNNNFTGPIPAQIGNLTRLQKLEISNNQLIGSIPPSISALPILKFVFNNNPGLNGTYSQFCGFDIFGFDTNVTLCGCSSSSSQVMNYPPEGTPDSCVATGAAAPLAKRVIVFSTNIDVWRFTCNTDSDIVSQANPFQDCLNTIFRICRIDYIFGNSARIIQCKTNVDLIFSRLSAVWQNYRRACGQWPYFGVRGALGSPNCTSANMDLKLSAILKSIDGKTQGLSNGLLNSVNFGLWSNPSLMEV